MENITIILQENGIKTTIAVRKKKDSVSKPTSNSYNISPNISIDDTLKVLGLEKIPYNELVPKYKKITKEDINDVKECSICQEEFMEKQYKRELSCNHKYHKKCVDAWLKTNFTCPICRKSVIH